MVLGLIASAALAAAPLKVASTPWVSSGLNAAFATSLEARFTSLLSEGGVSVVSPRDIEAVLGLERQRQLTGCAEESSCLAELGGALGVQVVLYASVVKAGSSVTANLRAISTKDAHPVFTASERVKSDDALQDWLDASARRLAGTLAVGAAPAVSTSAAGGSGSLVRWAPGTAGVVAGVAGAVLFFQGRAAADRLRTEVFPSAAAVTEVRTQGELQQQLGVGLGIVALAGIAASAAWVSFVPSSPPVALVPVSGGAVVGFSGEWP